MLCEIFIIPDESISISDFTRKINTKTQKKKKKQPGKTDRSTKIQNVHSKKYNSNHLIYLPNILYTCNYTNVKSFELPDKLILKAYNWQ